VVRPYWKLTVVVAPRGLSEPLRVAEELPINVAGLVVTAGVGVGVDAGVAVGVGVGVGEPFTTLTVPVIPQHCPWAVQ
jgi:hypothetical protein